MPINILQVVYWCIPFSPSWLRQEICRPH